LSKLPADEAAAVHLAREEKRKAKNRRTAAVSRERRKQKKMELEERQTQLAVEWVAVKAQNDLVQEIFDEALTKGLLASPGIMLGA
jgi:uncharacterized protein YggL (DUF469 family)